MSDADDQDKTRIAPRSRPKAVPISERNNSRDDYISAPPKPAPGSAKTETVHDPITQARDIPSVRPNDILKHRFVLERILGAGGMGVVYKAKDLLKVEAKDRDPYVAIKVLGEEFKSHPEAFIALQRESRKTQRIAHPNIVNVHDFDKDGDTVFMTMEFLEGTPLDKLIKKHRGVGLPVTQTWQILEGICAALAYAHEQRLIHSDLKPGNIFVTNAGLAKIFDFGIARAVAKAEQSDGGESEDGTVFDAGNLGALTPAYASLEMLEGDPPDVRDDIYALGCITYELLTGEHPFKRKNAKEAFRKGFKAERIKCITKRQWKVVESALALEREQRIGSVREFWEGLNQKQSSPITLWLAVIAVMLLVVVAFVQPWQYLEPEPELPQISEDQFRTELESKIRLEMVQQNLAELFSSRTFDTRWENNLWDEIQQLQNLLGIDEPLTQSAYQKAYDEYFLKINQTIEAENFTKAQHYINAAQKYTADSSELAALSQQVDEALAKAEAEKEAERARLAAAQKAAAEKAARAAALAREQAKSRASNEFSAALKTVNDQLKCNRILDMAYFERSLAALRAADASQYQNAEPQIVRDLDDCIGRITRNFPQEGLKAQNYAQKLFPNAKVFSASAQSVNNEDSCSASLAGLGSRGRRSRCQDALASGTKSPLTVVIPAMSGAKPFAIGRYEVSVGEFNQYCIASRSCKALPESNTMLPVTNINYKDVQAYLTWLSEQSGRIYRLPTKDEFIYAANSQSNALDSNRNCKLDIRGIQKGISLVNANIGQQNSWGVVNHVGNASEWVTDGKQLLSMGGSFNTDMENCTVEHAVKSDGRADGETGFRVLRELQ